MQPFHSRPARRHTALGVLFFAVITSLVTTAVVFAQTRPATTPATSRPATKPEVETLDRDVRFCEVVAGAIEDAHGGRAWRLNGAVQTDLKVEMDGQTVIDAFMVYEPHRNRVRLDLRDGTHLLHDGKKVWVWPASAKIDARRHLAIWPYFLSAPFRFKERGLRLAEYRSTPMLGPNHDTFKLTFKSGGEDNPNERYVIYADQRSHLLHVMGFTPRAAGPGQPAPESRAIVYSNYQNMGGVKLATSWAFYKWDEAHSIQGEPVGHAVLTNLQLAQPTDDAFTPPADAREVPPEH